METSSHTGTGNGSDKASAAMQAVKDKFNQMTRPAKRSAESLRGELADMKSDLDALVEHASDMSEDQLNDAHAKLISKFSSVKSTARGLADHAGRRLNRSMDTTTDYVKDKPMQSVAVAVAAGLLVGFLLKRH